MNALASVSDLKKKKKNLNGSLSFLHLPEMQSITSYKLSSKYCQSELEKPTCALIPPVLNSFRSRRIQLLIHLPLKKTIVKIRKARELYRQKL